MQRDERPVAEQPPPGRQREPRAAGAGARRWRAHARLRRICDEAADHDHADEDDALDDGREVRVDAEERHVGPDQLEDEDRDDRPEDAAPAAGQADAAEDDGGDAQQRVRARDRASRCRCSR